MKKHLRILAIAIAAILIALPVFAGTSPDKVNTDLKDLVFSQVKIEAADAPADVSIEKSITDELLRRGATQDKTGLVITGKATFKKDVTGNNLVRIYAEMETKGLAFAESVEYTQNEILTQVVVGRPARNENLARKLSEKVANTFAAQLNARRAASTSGPRNGAQPRR